MPIFTSDDIRNPAPVEGLEILTAKHHFDGVAVDAGTSHFVEDRRVSRTATGAARIEVVLDFEVPDPFRPRIAIIMGVSADQCINNGVVVALPLQILSIASEWSAAMGPPSMTTFRPSKMSLPSIPSSKV